jgi:hypothetical protein
MNCTARMETGDSTQAGPSSICTSIGDTLLNPCIDSSSFFRSWDASGLSPQDWFTPGFYEAIRETSGFDLPFDPLAPGSGLYSSIFGHHPFINPGHFEHGDEMRETISRMPSPPNIPSNEDSWAFAWNPSSPHIVKAPPVLLDDDDPLLSTHDPRFDITQHAWGSVAQFLRPHPSVMASTFSLPPLPVVNIFIGLFFTYFSPQAPVLHEPTVDTKILAPPLLSIVIVIGAQYSHRRNTRRWAILVLDRTRQNLQTAIENDNRLVRDAMVIYAYALICYTGLWCGNKRAFEMAKGLRGILVTYIRRLPTYLSRTNQTQTVDTPNGLESHWHTWVVTESRKRLMWFVFMIDS